MSSDPKAEIRASVGAHADLGPGYEDAVAEGLVERIGAEIDKRIEARLAQTGVPTPAGVPTPTDAAGPAGYPGFQGGYQGYLGPVLPPGYQLGPPPARPSPVGARNVATTITALGSVGLGVAATAIVLSAGSLGGQGFIILLIWVAIAIINVAYARHS
ncbi:MAG TPA: hypothetical protein VHS30_34580 [Streptosporangiaceae bacterium]|jgi:hypothetical protein|nr:hypothetical protein [Streptosporangiaceae bacterium]